MIICSLSLVSSLRPQFSGRSNNFILKKFSVNSRLAMSSIESDYQVYPELTVFDLDMCLWSPEMYTLDDIPTKGDAIYGPLVPGEDNTKGVIAVKSGYEQIKLFPAARKVLQDFYNNKYPGMKIAAASSADTPRAVKIGRTAMDILEILPGVTMRECFRKGWDANYEGNMQIGRTPPLSSDKADTHFPILQKATKIPYTKMLFFDDCNWGGM